MLESLLERWGENGSLAAGALVIGIAFGFLAQRSRFWLRSAVIEFARNQRGGTLTVWLFAFASATIGTQALAWAGEFDAGMILARAWSSHLLDQQPTGLLDQSMPGAAFGTR
jgi:hypothetical protein